MLYQWWRKVYDIKTTATFFPHASLKELKAVQMIVNVQMKTRKWNNSLGIFWYFWVHPELLLRISFWIMIVWQTNFDASNRSLENFQDFPRKYLPDLNNFPDYFLLFPCSVQPLRRKVNLFADISYNLTHFVSLFFLN